jgi:hypothetical protein
VSGTTSLVGTLGRRAPFLAAAAAVGRPLFVATTLAYLTYSLFDWFDRKEASAPRKRAISAWLKGQPYQQLDLKSVVVGAFDRLYGFPLISITGFFRASLVSFYVSLLIVRHRLVTGFKKPLVSLLYIFTLGTTIVIVSCVVLWLITYAVDIVYQTSDYHNTAMPQFLGQELLLVFYHPEYFKGVVPAFLAHVWLLLLVFGAVGVRLIFWFFRAVAGVQWLIKRGDERPITAIGMVAAVLLFTAALAWQLV